MSAPTATDAVGQAQAYLAAVEAELADLPVEDRTALREDLALHLEAMAAEDDDRPLAVRLGDPVAYAADLRSAAGLPARPGGTSGTGTGLRQRLARLRATPAVREVRRLLGELRPAWWVLRGYLLVFVPSAAEVDYAYDFPVPTPLNSPVLGLLLVAAAVAGSVALGRRSLSRVVGALVTVAGVVLVLLTLVVVDAATDPGGSSVEYYDPMYDPAAQQAMGEYPLLSRYGPVTDVLPYAADGTPLEGVLLYDQDGRPLQVGLQEWWADNCLRVLEQPLAADGGPVPHSFPQSYELYGEGVDLHTALPAPGQCLTEVPRPDVPLPVFPPTGSVAPAPGD